MSSVEQEGLGPVAYFMLVILFGTFLSCVGCQPSWCFWIPKTDPQLAGSWMSIESTEDSLHGQQAWIEVLNLTSDGKGCISTWRLTTGTDLPRLEELKERQCEWETRRQLLLLWQYGARSWSELEPNVGKDKTELYSGKKKWTKIAKREIEFYLRELEKSVSKQRHGF